jgi:F-type H+-transporting ATPase subunit a
MPGLMRPLFAAATEAPGEFDIKDMILHYIVDSDKWEFMWWTIYLPQFEPVQIGPLAINFSITKHVLFMFFAAVLVAALLIPAARRAQRERAAGVEMGPKGAANVVEAFILYLRDEVAKPNVGHHGERFYPYIISVFFFILACNLLGLVPWGTSPTANISVTAALAIITFVTVEAAGMRDLGFAQWSKTIFYAPAGTTGFIKYLMLVIMTPVEIMGKLTKPFALAIRLYANMTAGKAVMLALTGLLTAAAMANVLWVAPATILMAVGIMVLKIFVAFLQAYIFAMLSSVFIGLIRHAH